MLDCRQPRPSMLAACGLRRPETAKAVTGHHAPRHHMLAGPLPYGISAKPGYLRHPHADRMSILGQFHCGNKRCCALYETDSTDVELLAAQ